MKKIIVAVATIILISANIPTAQAGDRALGGLLIGGGSGAIVGHTIGRNAEATIIGATVGGVLGLIVGNELDRSHVVVHTRHQPVVHHREFHHYRHAPPRGYHHPGYSRYSPRHTYKEIHKETVIIKEKRYSDRHVVKNRYRDHHRPYQHNSHHRPGKRYYR